MFNEIYNFKKHTLFCCTVLLHICELEREKEGGRGKEGGREGGKEGGREGGEEERERETLEDVHSLLEGSKAESEGGSGKDRGSDSHDFTIPFVQ